MENVPDTHSEERRRGQGSWHFLFLIADIQMWNAPGESADNEPFQIGG